MAAWRSATDRKTPRFRRRLARTAKKPSTALSQEAEVGVKSKVQRGWRVFAFPVAVRRIIYTTNAIESLNAKLRRAVRTRGHFPTDEAAIKLLYLVLRQIAQTWKMPTREWCEAKTQFAIMFDDRFVKA